MEYILSFDVGIKNLAFCLFEKEQNSIKIIKWDIINLIDTEGEVLCLELNNNNDICNKKAIYMKNNNCYCLKHSKKTDYLIPTLELKKTKLNKMNIKELKQIASKYYINFELNTKKKNLIDKINAFIDEKTLQPIKINKCKDFDLVALGIMINEHFNILFTEYINNIKHVCIELQMTSKMRSLSYMIMQYFLVKNKNINVKMISPSFKLKDLEPEKTDYSTRKKNSIKHCIFYLKKNNFDNWINFIEKNKKKDDLSDCFLQGIYAIDNLKFSSKYA